MSVDAEVYDEMHHKTISIHYHTHKALGTWVVFYYARRLVPGVSERQRTAVRPRYLR